MHQIVRYMIETDDEGHEFLYAGEVVHVACPANRTDTVEFWVLYDLDADEALHVLKAYGTNAYVPSDAKYLGTTVRVMSHVWHLFELAEE